MGPKLKEKLLRTEQPNPTGKSTSFTPVDIPICKKGYNKSPLVFTRKFKYAAGRTRTKVLSVSATLLTPSSFFNA